MAHVEFRPQQGLMGIAERIARRAGLGDMWAGDDGIEGVLRQVLQDARVPEGVPLTPRAIAENAGLIRKQRRVKRVRTS